MIFSPLVMTQVFGFFTGGALPVHLPGAAFGLSAVLMALGLVLYAARARSVVAVAGVHRAQ